MEEEVEDEEAVAERIGGSLGLSSRASCWLSSNCSPRAARGAFRNGERMIEEMSDWLMGKWSRCKYS